MELSYYGAGCLYITVGKLKILIDPLPPDYGKMSKLKSDVVLFTQAQPEEILDSYEFTIDNPGEYEIKNVTIEGIGSRLHTDEPGTEKGVMYTVTFKGVRTLITGNIAPELSEEQLERADGVDVLVLPVGGHGLTLDKEAASTIARQLEPSFVVPVHYDDGKIKYPMPQDKLEDFLHEVGAIDSKPVDKFKVTGNDLTGEMSVVVLKRAI